MKTPTEQAAEDALKCAEAIYLANIYKAQPLVEDAKCINDRLALAELYAIHSAAVEAAEAPGIDWLEQQLKLCKALTAYAAKKGEK